jgi:hypothetical protein
VPVHETVLRRLTESSLCFSGKKNEFLGHLRELTLELQLSEFLFPNDRISNLTNTLGELNAIIATP